MQWGIYTNEKEIIKMMEDILVDIVIIPLDMEWYDEIVNEEYEFLLWY